MSESSAGQADVIRPMRPGDVETVSGVIVASIRASLPARYPPDVVEGLVAGNDPHINNGPRSGPSRPVGTAPCGLRHGRAGADRHGLGLRAGR